MADDLISALRDIRRLCDPMDAKFDGIKNICDNAICGHHDGSISEPKYEKFIVLWNKGNSRPNAMPWTGIDQTMRFIQEKLEDGCTVQVKPYTREEWANKK